MRWEQRQIRSRTRIKVTEFRRYLRLANEIAGEAAAAPFDPEGPPLGPIDGPIGTFPGTGGNPIDIGPLPDRIKFPITVTKTVTSTEFHCPTLTISHMPTFTLRPL